MTGGVQMHEIERLIERLEEAAAKLRGGELSDEEAAALVEECASLAVQAGTELERRARGEDSALPGARAGGQDPLTGPQQDTLL